MDYLDYDKYYLHDTSDLFGCLQYPIDPGDLPEAVDEKFGELVKDPGTPWHRVEFSRVSGQPDIYVLSCHETAPFNPSGFEFYFRGDGTYLGFLES